MLHIILSLLKITGVFLLILLGILLFLILVVLAAPVTYDFSGGWDGQPKLQGRIHWLYHIIGVSVNMEGRQPDVQISIFGHIPGTGKRAKKPKPSRKGRKKQTWAEDETPVQQKKPDKSEKAQSEERQMEFSEQRESIHQSESIHQPELKELPEPEKQQEMEHPQMESEKLPESVQRIEMETEADSQEKADFDRLLEEELEKAEKEKTGGEIKEEKGSIPDEEPLDRENSIWETIRRVSDFANQPSVRLLLRRLWSTIRRMIRHLRPSRLQIHARIGTGDPDLTGRIMEIAAILYAFYNENIEITAEFDEKVLEARFSVRGWLVPGYLLIMILRMALSIFFNRECRAFYREIRESLT